MIKYKVEKVEKEIESIESVTCDYCGMLFDATTTQCYGYGHLEISFGYGSKFDDDHYFLQICDNCFIKHFQHKFIKEGEKP